MFSTIKKRIWGGFLSLVLLFVINGVATIIIINKSKTHSFHVKTVIDPAEHLLQQLKTLITESKMYATNWVFLRSNEEDKVALKRLIAEDYPAVKRQLQHILPQLKDQQIAARLQTILANFEHLQLTEQQIMALLRRFEDYDDPVRKMTAEQIIEDQVIPVSAALLGSMDKVAAISYREKTARYDELEHYTVILRALIMLLAIIVVAAGILLALYFSNTITTPIEKIRAIINDLGRGVINKVDHRESSDEIGRMITSVNSLSEKIGETAVFAQEIGNRNFSHPFQPLSNEDALGAALLTMRDNLKTSEDNLLRTSSSLIRRHKALEQYTYIISHNLRAPVATIRGLAELLHTEGLEADERNMAVRGLLQSVDSLDVVIHDLNQILQMKNDLHETTEKISFERLMKELDILFHDFIEEDVVEIHSDFKEVPNVKSLKSYFSSIFYNLVSNSIKYRQPGIKLQIDIKSYFSNGRVVLMFSDNGKGIDIEKHGENLFGLYQRFDFSVEGKGMGLFMIKNQVENLDGTITVSSAPGEGTTFKISLPGHIAIQEPDNKPELPDPAISQL